MDDIIKYETYQLTLTHYIQLPDGEKSYLDDPYVLVQLTPCEYGLSEGTIINQMLDRFKHELLRMLSERGKDNG